MEQVIRFYGKFMIEGIVLFLVIVILFNGIGVEEGILVFAGKNVKIDMALSKSALLIRRTIM